MDIFLVLCGLLLMYIFYRWIKHIIDVKSEENKKLFKQFIDNINNKEFLEEIVNDMFLSGKIIITDKNNTMCVNIYDGDKLFYSGIRIPPKILLINGSKIKIVGKMLKRNDILPSLGDDEIRDIDGKLYYHKVSVDGDLTYIFDPIEVKVRSCSPIDVGAL